MAGKSIIVVGGTGTGKTTIIKGRLDKVDKRALYLYDVNNEYQQYTKMPLVSFDIFSKKAKQLSNSVQVWEEMTIFLDNKSSNKDLMDVLVRKRHTNNLIFLVFHSLRRIPRSVFDLSNIIILFKTNDNEKFVDDRFQNEEVTQAFKRVRDNKDPHYFEVVKIA
jgi:ABC-type Mn2+/Zn2+ transport system ATPase subunit